MPDPDPYAPFRAEKRAQFGYCGPYRLGIAIGEAGSDLPSPYTNPKSTKSFNDGVIVGRQQAAHEETKRNIRIAIWNACRDLGIGQEPAQALIRRAMVEPLMFKALKALRS